MRHLLLVLIAALCVPTLASADAFGELRGALESIRAGKLEPAAIKKLKRLAARGPARSAAALVLSRALARLGDADGARQALKRAGGIKNVSTPALIWAEIEVLLAEGEEAQALERLTSLRRRFKSFRWAAADILFSRLTEKLWPAEMAADAALKIRERSRIRLPGDELVERAARLLRAKRPRRATALYRQLVIHYPESPLALAAAKAGLAGKLSTDDQLAIAERLFERRAYEACRAYALPLWKEGVQRKKLGYFLGKIGSERLRDDYAGAEKYLKAASHRNGPFALQALSSYGIVLSKLNKHNHSIATFNRWLTRYGTSAKTSRVVEAHYDRGRALHKAGLSKQAATELAAYLSRHPRGYDGPKYWWFVGWWQYLGGDKKAAVRTWKPLLKRRNPLEGGKARYWTARALRELGDKPRSIAVMAALVKAMPLSWYGALAEQRLIEWGQKKTLASRPDLSGYKRRVADPFAGLPASRELSVLKLAAHLGEPDTALRVLNSLSRRLGKSLGRERLTKLTDDLAGVTEQFHIPRRAARRAHHRVLRRYPSRRTVRAWRTIYPRAYATHVVASTAKTAVPEWMVYAHMLQESRFNPSAISGAPAFGVLQILDRTGVRLAQQGPDDYQLWMLMEPRFNVRWAVRYLDGLIRKFDGQLAFAMGSYNGGPMLFERHLSRAKGLEYDVMVEEIGPHESRNYLRKVAEHTLRYLAIYEKPKRAAEIRRALFPLKWKAGYLPKPDF